MTHASLPLNYPAGYPVSDYIKARSLDLALFWGNLLRTGTSLAALFAIFYSGLAERIGSISAPKLKAWLVRISFLAAVFLVIRGLELPFLYFRFQQGKVLGLTLLSTAAWLNLFVVSLVVPLSLFVFKYLFVTCTLPLCGRFWWVAAALGLFLIGDVAPDLISRTYPVDPTENVHAIGPGPQRESMRSLLRVVGLDLPIMVLDESGRSNTAQICLTGRPGREYVLVSDTFLRDYSPKQVNLALAHELGHFQRRTTSWLIEKMSSLLLLLLSFLLAFSLSGRRALPVEASPRIVVLSVVCSILIGNLVRPVLLLQSRQEERFADRYALRVMGKGNASEFQQLLLKVAQREKEPLDMPGWRYYWSAGHPTFLERIAQAQED